MNNSSGMLRHGTACHCRSSCCGCWCCQGMPHSHIDNGLNIIITHVWWNIYTYIVSIWGKPHYTIPVLSSCGFWASSSKVTMRIFIYMEYRVYPFTWISHVINSINMLACRYNLSCSLSWIYRYRLLLAFGWWVISVRWCLRWWDIFVCMARIGRVDIMHCVLLCVGSNLVVMVVQNKKKTTQICRRIIPQYYYYLIQYLY